MHQIIQFQAEDGRIFPTGELCRDHERMVIMVRLVMEPLGSKTGDHYGWIQHSRANYQAAQRGIVALLLPTFEGFDWFKKEWGDKLDAIQPRGGLGRIVDECAPELLRNAWYRLGCIDDQFREHQQWYHAINGPDAHQKCLEDRS